MLKIFQLIWRNAGKEENRNKGQMRLIVNNYQGDIFKHNHIDNCTNS